MKSQPERIREAVTVRSANRDDAVDVACIYVDAWNVGSGDLMPRQWVTAELGGRWQQELVRPVPQRWGVAERPGTLVGFVGMGPSRDPIAPELGELDTIAVDPSAWRTGIGRTLMAVALRHLTANGYREAVLWTLAR